MAVMAMCVLLSCTEKKEEATLSGLMKSDFVSEVQGKQTALYVLKNQKGAEACVTNWGGRLVSVMVPDKDGKMTDVVLGYDNIQQYVDNPNNNYGGLIGRYGNRIAMVSSRWTGLNTSFRRIITDTACTVVRKVIIRLCGMPNK